MENFKNFGEDMSGLICGKLILEIIGDLEMIVHVNLTDLSCGESVIDNVDPDLLGRN
jgi:hypothetical protein